MYGRGVASIAEQIHGTKEEAQEIIDNFYKAFPSVKGWMDKTKSDAYKNGYVEDVWGRRRRLKDIQLDKYTVEFDKGSDEDVSFNPLIGATGKYQNPKSQLLEKYRKLAEETKFQKQLNALALQAKQDGIILHSNSNKIAQAERQCVNARVQGSAASMSKKAMIKVHNDPELNRMGFKILIAVHDELIGECPEEYADAVAERLTEVMKHSAEPDVVVPFKCDPTIEKCWYYSDYSDNLISEYRSKLEGGMSSEDIIKVFLEEHSECTEEQLREMLSSEIN